MKINKGGILGEVLEQGGTLLKQTGKVFVKTPVDLTKAGGSQINPQAGNPQTDSNQQENAQKIKQDKDFVKELYGLNEQPKKETDSQKSMQKLAEKQPQKSPEELQKIQALRQELHKTTYYQPLVNPQKKQEERPAEKIENEKNKERWELQEKEAKKPPPLAVKRAQNIEKFRGASG